MAKKSSYQKLKEEVERLKTEYASLYSEFNRYSTGKMSFIETQSWKMRFKMEDAGENMIWAGESSSLKDGDLVEFNGMIHEVIKQK